MQMNIRDFLNQTVRIKIDRPIGAEHPDYRELIYPVNYGYIPGTLGGDGEAIDVYLLGIDYPANEYTAQVIGIVHRKDDIEQKLIAAPHGMRFTKEQVWDAIVFQEQYFQSTIELIGA